MLQVQPWRNRRVCGASATYSSRHRLGLVLRLYNGVLYGRGLHFVLFSSTSPVAVPLLLWLSCLVLSCLVFMSNKTHPTGRGRGHPHPLAHKRGCCVAAAQREGLYTLRPPRTVYRDETGTSTTRNSPWAPKTAAQRLEWAGSATANSETRKKTRVERRSRFP